MASTPHLDKPPLDSPTRLFHNGYMVARHSTPSETNLGWQTPSATLKLTDDSFWGGGTNQVHWDTGGLSNVVISADYKTMTFNPSNSGPGAYEVRAWSALQPACVDVCTVNVVKVEMNTNLWWFGGENPGGGYDVEATLTVGPVTTGVFAWEVTAGASIIVLNNGSGDSGSIIAINDTNITVKSTGASTSTGDVTIALSLNDVWVCNYTLTVRKPGTPQLLSGFPTDVALGTGFKTTYRFKVVDQFYEDVPFEMPVNESFGTWNSDWLFEIWPEPTPNGTLTTNKEFSDNYGLILGFPLPVNPSDSDAGVAVQHATQFYRAGSTNSGSGILIKQHTLQYYRGRAREL